MEVINMNNKRIIYKNTEGGVSVIVPANNSDLTIEEIAAKDVPEGITFDIVETVTVPSDRTFRSAWDINASAVVTDMPKAKVIAHDMRRVLREEEMAPYDDIVMKQVPGSDAGAAEASRAQLRTKYATMQTDIDAATTPEELKTILGV